MPKPLRASRHLADQLPADVAGGVGVDEVLAQQRPLLELRRISSKERALCSA